MKDANTIIEESVSQREEVYSHLRAAADFFHEHEGTFFERGEAITQLSDELSIEQDIAGQVIAELVGDIVDPVVLSAVNGEKYVGVVEFEEFDGAYGYVDYHDVRGPDKRVVCQQCVNGASVDTQVAHATAGDPSGTVSSGADYDELLDIVHEHYANSHEEMPEDVATGATLASGTTIGGNESWHAGNDGTGSGLDADNIQGTDASTFASNAAPVQSVNGGTGDVSVDHSGLANIQRDNHHTPVIFEFNPNPEFFGGNSNRYEEIDGDSFSTKTVVTSNGNAGFINEIDYDIGTSVIPNSSGDGVDVTLDRIDVFNSKSSNWETVETIGVNKFITQGDTLSRSNTVSFTKKFATRARLVIDLGVFDEFTQVDISFSPSASIQTAVFE